MDDMNDTARLTIVYYCFVLALCISFICHLLDILLLKTKNKKQKIRRMTLVWQIRTLRMWIGGLHNQLMKRSVSVEICSFCYQNLRLVLWNSKSGMQKRRYRTFLFLICFKFLWRDPVYWRELFVRPQQFNSQEKIFEKRTNERRKKKNLSNNGHIYSIPLYISTFPYLPCS